MYLCTLNKYSYDITYCSLWRSCTKEGMYAYSQGLSRASQAYRRYVSDHVSQ